MPHRSLPQAFFHSPCAGLRVGPLCRHASTWLCAVLSRDCFLAPASSNSTCFDIPSKATSSRIASATTVCAVSNQGRVACATKGFLHLNLGNRRLGHNRGSLRVQKRRLLLGANGDVRWIWQAGALRTGRKLFAFKRPLLACWRSYLLSARSWSQSARRS